jgi:hypothetical protein
VLNSYDEEGGLGYTNGTVVTFNRDMRVLMDSVFGSKASTTTPHWVLDQWAGGNVTSWDTIAAYRGQIVGASHYTWTAPQLYSTAANNFAESACRSHSSLCAIYAPTVYGAAGVPGLSTRTYPIGIPHFGSRPWFIRFS